MNGKYFALSAITLMVVVVAAACAPTAAAPQEPPSGEVGQPVAAVERAPICQGGGACKPPSATQYETDCVNKIPYTNVLVEPGTAFEVLDKSGDFTCNETTYVVDGKTVISCYGTQLYTFDLKLTNTSCGGAELQEGTGQCEEGYGYDAAQQCCAPLGGDGGNSTVVSIELGDCPLPNVPGLYVEEGTPEP